MGTISSELKTIKDNVGKDALGDMNTMCDDLEKKLSELESICSTSKSVFNSYYQSEQKDLILSSFDCMAKIYSEIESSVNSTLKTMVTNVSSIVDSVSKLEDINTEIDSLKNVLNNNKGDDSNSVSIRNQTNIEINKKNIEFTTIHNDALNKLHKVKSMDVAFKIPEFEMANKEKSSESKNEVIVSGGIFEQRRFVSSNGVAVDYYIYVPKVKDSTSKLPILTYFHGIQDTVDRNRSNNFKYGGGLAGLIETKQLSPKGIVLFPQAINGLNDKAFWSRGYQEAVIELIKDTAKKHNGDLKRVSVAGHSNGGAAAQHIVNNYPGFFAATALMGIASNAKEGLAQTHLYALVGAKDHTMDNYGRAISFAQKNHQMYKVYNMGHDIQTIAFKEPVADENGKSVMLVDWLMSKSL